LKAVNSTAAALITSTKISPFDHVNNHDWKKGPKTTKQEQNSGELPLREAGSKKAKEIHPETCQSTAGTTRSTAPQQAKTL